MQLEIKLPELNERSFDTAKGTKLVLDYMYQLNRQLRYVLNNLEEENLSQDISEKLSSVDGLKDEIKDTVRQDAYYANNIIVNNSIGQLGEDVAIQAQTISLQGEKIDLNTINISENEGRISLTEIRMGDAELTLSAHDVEITDQGTRISSAEFRLDGAEANILLKVDKNGVIAAINLTPEVATIQASKINLEGYVTATQLSTEIAAIENSFSNMVSTKVLYAQNIFQYQGWTVGLSENKFVTSVRFPTLSSQRISRLIEDDAYVVVGYAQNGNYSSDDYRYLSY